jgi:hypothetical protein
MENSFHVTVQFDKSKLTLWYLQTLLMLAREVVAFLFRPFCFIAPKEFKIIWLSYLSILTVISDTRRVH